MEWSGSISLNSLNPSVFVVETKKEFKIYLSSVKSGHAWSFLQAGKIDLYYPLEISRFCPTTGEKKICLVLFTIISKPFINQAWLVKMARYWLRFFLQISYSPQLDRSFEKVKIELDQCLGHRNLIRLYNNTYIIMLP